MRLFVHSFVAAWFAYSATAAGAADIRMSDHPLYSVILEGTIVPGDYDKLRKLIDENCSSKSWNTSCPWSIYLASSGGSVSEAMKIGRLVRTLRFGTQVPLDVVPDAHTDIRRSVIKALKLQEGNYLCASACFFIAVAGIERDPSGAELRIGKVILGIHRPYMNDAELKTLSANEIMASATQVRTVVETYLKEMGVPLKYADLMFSIPKDQVRWITNADYQADFDGAADHVVTTA
jgi:hypothetical protein